MIKIANNVNKKDVNNIFSLIPKYEDYAMYILDSIILKLPKIEKYNIGNEFKIVMYRMISNIMYLNKVKVNRKMDYCNNIDADISVQRILIRIMYKERYIDRKKYEVSMGLLDEIGSIVGACIKTLGIKYE